MEWGRRQYSCSSRRSG